MKGIKVFSESIADLNIMFSSEIWRKRSIITYLTDRYTAACNSSRSLMSSELLQRPRVSLAPQDGHLALGNLEPQVTFRRRI